jgi:hypothetical protein
VSALRIVIAGAPRTGKTTLALELGGRLDAQVLHTDSVIHLGWSEASLEVTTWFIQPGPWIVEGVAAVRALRKWLRVLPNLEPCDLVIWLDEPVVEQSSKQRILGKGCETVWEQTLPLLQACGVRVVAGVAAAREAFA